MPEGNETELRVLKGEEALKLALLGRDEWNKWADNPGNDGCKVDFRDVEFEIEPGKENFFSGYRFPGEANFQGATFSGSALFKGATFSGSVSFVGATFTGLSSHAAVVSSSLARKKFMRAR